MYRSCIRPSGDAPILEIAQKLKESLTGHPEMLRKYREDFENAFKDRLDQLWLEYLISRSTDELSATMPEVNTPIEALGLRDSAVGILHGFQINTLLDLMMWSTGSLADMKGIGKNTVERIREAIASILNKQRC